MNKGKDFFKTCFNIVASLEVTNESQAIAKEVVLNEVENLQQENKNQKEIVTKIKMELIENEILDDLPFDVSERICALFDEVTE